MATRTGTYYTGTISGQTGTLITLLDTVLVTGEGWTKLYSGTNKAIYQQPAGSGFVIRALDDGSLAAGASEAVVRAAESATDVDTLVDPFPLTTQLADASCVWRKSDTADATARTYHAIADDRSLILYIVYGSFASDCYWFGDEEPYWSGDNYACSIAVRRSGNDSTGGRALEPLLNNITQSSSVLAGRYYARTEDGLTKSVLSALSSRCTNFGNIGAGGVMPYPNPTTGKLHILPAVASSLGGTSTTIANAASVRGRVPFLFEPMLGSTWTGLSVADTFTDTAYDASSTFLLLSTNNSTTGSQKVVLQTAGTWTVP